MSSVSSTNPPSTATLREENALLSAKLEEAKQRQAQLGKKLCSDIQGFEDNSKRTLSEMSQQILIESGQANKLLHELTNKYESVLKDQIKMLTENQALTRRKDEEELKFKTKVDGISGEYERKIEEIERSLKANMKKVADLQGPGLIRILLKNPRFLQEIAKRGGNVENILQRTQQEALFRRVNEKQEEIKELQQSNAQIDEEVSKMGSMMDTFNKLLQNMKLERTNLQKQNTTLGEKLLESRSILLKLMGRMEGQAAEQEVEDGGEEEPQS